MNIAAASTQPPKTVPYDKARYAPVTDSWEVGQNSYDEVRDLLATDPQGGRATYRFREASREEVVFSALGGAVAGAVGGALVAAVSPATLFTAAAVGATLGASVMGGMAGYQFITHPEKTIEGSLLKHGDTHYFMPDGATEAVNLEDYAWAEVRATGVTGREQWWG